MIDGRNVLFSKTIGREEETISISVSADEEIGLALSVPHSIVVYEAMNAGVPVVVASFSDAEGNLVNSRNLDTTITYYLDIGTVQDTIIQRVPMKISSIVMGNKTVGHSKSVQFDIHLVHESWASFSLESKTRGWSNMTMSDVVKEVASYFETVDVSTTKGVEESIIQPYWPDVRLMRWLANRAVSADGKNNYVYGITLEGEFFFKPISDLHENMNDIFDEREDEPLVFNSRERSHSLSKEGASGVITNFYDYETGTYSSQTITYDDATSPSLSDWTLIDPSLKPHLTINYGRDPHGKSLSTNRVSRIGDSFETLKAVTRISTGIGIRVGQTVNITLKGTPSTDMSVQYSEGYSGKYVVAETKLIFSDDRGRQTMNTELTLIRQGVNDGEARNYKQGKK